MPSHGLPAEILLQGSVITLKQWKVEDLRNDHTEQNFNLRFTPEPRESPFYIARTRVLPQIDNLSLTLDRGLLTGQLVVTPEREIPRLPVLHKKLPSNAYFIESGTTPELLLGFLPITGLVQPEALRFAALGLLEFTVGDEERFFGTLGKILQQAHIICVGKLAPTLHVFHGITAFRKHPELASAFSRLVLVKEP